MFNLSVVSIVPDAHKDAINQIAQLCGCHSWWRPEDYAVFSDNDLRQQVVPAELQPSLEFLYERLMLDGSAQENWQTALEDLNLTQVIEESNV